MLWISPQLYNAKIDLEDSKGSALFEKNLKVYNQLVEQAAKENGVSLSEVMCYMDEAYAGMFEGPTPEEIAEDILANAR